MFFRERPATVHGAARLAWLLLASLVVAACTPRAQPSAPAAPVLPKPAAPAQPQPAAPAPAVTLRYLAVQPGEQALIDRFMRQTPDVRIETLSLAAVPTDTDLYEYAAQQAQAGKLDVVPLFGPLDDLITRGALLDLDPFIQKDNLDLSPYRPLVDTLRYQGKLFEMPVQWLADAVLWRREMFTREGVALPAPGWTWDNLQVGARQLTRGNGDQKVWGAVAASPRDLFIHAVFQYAGGPEPTPAAVRQAAQRFGTMLTEDRSLPLAAAGHGVTYRVPGQEWQAGSAAMTILPVTDVADATRSVKFAWDVTPLPVAPGGKVVVSEVRSLGISARTANREAAWRFLRFMAGAEGAAALAGQGGLPVFHTPAVRQAFLQRLPAPPAGAAALFDQAYSLLRPIPWDQRASKLDDALGQAATDLLAGTVPWQRVADNFTRSYQQIAGQGR